MPTIKGLLKFSEYDQEIPQSPIAILVAILNCNGTSVHMAYMATECLCEQLNMLVIKQLRTNNRYLDQTIEGTI